ncbi:MAG: aldo/keto reductase [Methylococcaceae bacterium]|nr:aldo/keto reductase [Methylococcaceae bacterium]
MNYRPLGRTDIAVSEISLGCWTLGGLNWVDGQVNGWAEVNEDDITAAVKRAVDAGVNHFDNADVYGNGRAERMLARVLKTLGLKSEQFIVATKVGHFRGTAEHAYDPIHIRHQCEQSLRNLQRDYVDIYYLHHGDFGPDGEWLGGAAATLDALVKEGKVRIKGQSAYSDADFARAVPVVKPAVLQSWGNALRPNFIKPDSAVGRLLAEHGMSFVAFSPLQKGILLDKFDPDHPPTFEEGDVRSTDARFQPEFLRAMKPRLARLKTRFGATTGDLAAVALRYVLNHPNVACVIPGFRNESQVACNLGGVTRRLSDEDIAFIDRALAST